jgi:hypothetical protein
MKWADGDPPPSFSQRMSAEQASDRVARVGRLGSASVHPRGQVVPFDVGVYYHFARIHKTLRVTPSMAAGLSDHVWSLEEIVVMADSYIPKPAKRPSGRTGDARLHTNRQGAQMPSFENLKKQAKLYLRWHRDGYYPVAAQIRALLPRFRHLTDQAVLAQRQVVRRSRVGCEKDRIRELGGAR